MSFIIFDGHQMTIQPTSLDWQPPQAVARSGTFAPIRGQYWTCGLSLTQETLALYSDWMNIFNSAQHTVTLPYPGRSDYQTFTCYSEIRGIRYDMTGDCPIVAGVDVELSGIVI